MEKNHDYHHKEFDNTHQNYIIIAGAVIGHYRFINLKHDFQETEYMLLAVSKFWHSKRKNAFFFLLQIAQAV